MGTYRIEFTFDIDDMDLNDLVLQQASHTQRLQLPDGSLFVLDEIPDEQQMDSAASGMSLDNRGKIYNLVAARLSEVLGTWLNCPVHPSGPTLQVVDLDDPEAPPMPPIIPGSSST